MTDALRSAARKLHDSRTALPDNERGTWRYEDDECRVVSGVGRAMAVGAFDEDKPSLKHIALTASPDVTEALEQLLTDIDQYADAHDGGALIRRAADALAAAINRETP